MSNDDDDGDDENNGYDSDDGDDGMPPFITISIEFYSYSSP